MARTLRLLDTKARGRPDPHRMRPTGSTWTDPVGRECLLDHIRLAERLREATGEPWSFEAAVVDIYLDTDRGGDPRPQSGAGGYEARWGWSRIQVRHRWDDLLEAVSDWRSAYGRLADRSQSVATEQPPSSHENGDSGENSQSHSHGVATEQPPSSHADIYRAEIDTNTNTNAQPQTPHTPPEGGASEDGEDGGKKGKAKPSGPRITAAELEEIYRAYPRLIGKEAALRAIRTALKKSGAPTPAEMLSIVRSYAEAVAEWSAPDRRFVPHPSTWFHQGRYFDDPKEWQREGSGSEAVAPLDHAAYSRLPERERTAYRPIHAEGRLSWITKDAPTPAGYESGRPPAAQPPNQAGESR